MASSSGYLSFILEQLSGLLRHGKHFLCLFRIHCHRLFAEDVCTAAECSYGSALMSRIPCADADAVEVFFCHHLVVIGVGIRDSVLFAVGIQLVFVDIAGGNNVNEVFVLFISCHMAVAYVSRADYADAELSVFHCCILPNLSFFQ